MKPRKSDVPPDVFFIFFNTDPPAAILSDDVSTTPLNLTAGELPVLIYREKGTGRVRAYERRIDDLRPRFVVNTDPKRPAAWLIDSDTNSGWNTTGKAIDGHASRENRQLATLPVDEGLYWNVVHYWFPDIALLKPPPEPKPATMPDVGTPEQPARTRPTRATRTRR